MSKAGLIAKLKLIFNDPKPSSADDAATDMGTDIYDEVAGGAGDEITDADGDTKVQCEESADEDKIRFDTAGTEAMIIDDNQNVGIGTSSPESLFTIQDDTAQPRLTIRSDADYAPGIFAYSDRNSTDEPVMALNAYWDGTRVGSIQIMSGDDTVNKDDGYIRFRTTQSGVLSTKMTIEQDGNVGIGTTSPSKELHVKGSGRFGESATSTNGSVEIQSSNGVLWDFQTDGTSSLDITHNAGAAADFTISGANGVRVGIGTTSPGNRLEVEDDVASDYVARFFNDGNNANRYGIEIQAGADNGSGQTYYIYCYDGDGNGVGYIENNAGTFQLVDVSDEHLKTNIKPTKINGTNIIMGLKIKEFNYKKSGEFKDAGLVYQDVKKVYSPATSIFEQDGKEYGGVAEQRLITPLIKCVQEQQQEIEELKTIIKDMDKRLKKEEIVE